jgi:hypothetical protein
MISNKKNVKKMMNLGRRLELYEKEKSVWINVKLLKCFGNVMGINE